MSLTLLILACSGGDSVSGPKPTAGTYDLTSVQGKPLPYRIYSDVNYSVDVSAGSIALNTDGTFRATMRSEETVENHLSVYADTAVGSWTLTATKVDLVTADGSHSVGTLANGSITITDSSTVVPLVYVYTQH